MKRNAVLCLCLCLCLLVSACATPMPEESSVPTGDSLESSEVISPVVEDPNAEIVRADLEGLLEAEWSALWLTDDRAETIRERVKALKTPILTEEDVLRIAERAAERYLSAWQEGSAITLPACGMMDAVSCFPLELGFYEEHEAGYSALLAYTLYLFTPPNYVFWGSEIWNEGWYPATDSGVDPSHALCFPFAGDYTTRSDALDAIREQQSCIRLYPLFVSDGEYPLDFKFSGTADLLLGERCAELSLNAMSEEVLPYRTKLALEYLRPRLERCVHPGTERPFVLLYGGSTTDDLVCIPFYHDEVQTVREMADLLPSPLLTEQDVRGLVETFDEEHFADWGVKSSTFVLPGLNGDEDFWIGPYELPGSWRLRVVLLHLIDMFTPSAFRTADLFEWAGTYYALDGDGASYVLVTGTCELYLVDETGDPERLCVASPEGGLWE